MSKLRIREKPARMNFSNGFTLFASITVHPQKHKDRKVIFQIVRKLKHH